MKPRLLLALIAAALFAALIIAASGLFGPDDSGSPETTAVAGTSANPLVAGHTHGIARHPTSGDVYVATHDGLFVISDTGPSRVDGPTVDLMGFTMTESGDLLSSGHPGVGTDLPQPVGLIDSVDGGKTWTVRSRGGQSDFHALTSSTRGLLGYDGRLRASQDGRTWRDLPMSADVTSLGASPDGAQVLAATSAGLQASTTYGDTWTPVADAPALVLLDWADARQVVGVDQAGRVFISSDKGGTWKPVAAHPLGPPQAIGASIGDGQLEILAVTGTSIVRSSDRGATFAPLT
ncbi:hypothetical protein N802_11455 [Knoellia sinensis KCTC 19936]|uniref:Exo-alpha-sialidase n=1 Tax=Knoellia sinensis KCTC 19936 TaxID=1385520 RepID=A0A0A0IX10_9MICO|nr:hypothetical protein [Knoellia sinensis]KGN29760.1 hypothetical protein N802_11455 [Knoellia sinensis KCTC 19936]